MELVLYTFVSINQWNNEVPAQFMDIRILLQCSIMMHALFPYLSCTVWSDSLSGGDK